MKSQPTHVFVLAHLLAGLGFLIAAEAKAAEPLGTISAAGYEQYFPADGVITSTDIAGQPAAALRRALRAEGKAPVLQRKGDEYTLQTQEHTTPWRFTTTLGSNGPRYAGPLVATQAAAGVARGFEVAGQVTGGLPGGSESDGGSYKAAAGSIMQPMAWGAWGVQAQASDYLLGGYAKDMKYTGQNATVSAVSQFYLPAGFGAEAKLNYNYAARKLGMLGFTDTFGYASAAAALSYSGTHAGWQLQSQVGVEQGLGGQRDVSDVPLLRRVDGNFTAVTAQARASRYFDALRGAGVVISAAAQQASANAPAAQQFVIGGQGRGAGFAAGAAAGSNGESLDVRLDSPLVATSAADGRAFAGVDAATARQGAHEQRVSSAYVGVAARYKDLDAQLIYAKKLESHGVAGDPDRVLFSVSFAF